MKRNEIVNISNQLDNHIGVYQIEIGNASKASYILGCYLDSSDSIWKIYENDERGLQSIIYQADDEEIAYNKLNKLINIQKRLNKNN